MLESQWPAALASNNITAIIRWLRKLTAEGDRVEEILPTFSCWVQRTSEFAKKELLTLCLSRCRGLWMFLDKSSFTRVHMLLQRLGNLLTLAQWARRQLGSAHLWHGEGVPCAVCRDVCGSSEVRRGCWNRAYMDLRQHIWLGRLVQWWGITGLLPRHPDAQEVRRISQMWKEMDRKASPGFEEVGVERLSSFIQGMVTQLHRQHGCVWTSEDCTDQRYPPPDLQALLKLVLVPYIDNMSVQAILMYFILDMANFLQCKDDLLRSFCHAFTIPPGFSQQIRALWMLDHGHVVASMELLLSPRASVPWLSWQHRCILRCLLARKQPRLALRYLHWTTPVMESAEDAKLCMDVLLQNSRVSDAWAVLRKGHTESEDMVDYFLQTCEAVGLHAEALKYIPVGHYVEGDDTAGSQLLLIKKAGRPPCPLSARLYQAQKENTVSPEELIELVSKAVMEVREVHPKISGAMWPEHSEREFNSREMFRPSPADMAAGTEHTAQADKLEEKPPIINNQPEIQGYIPYSPVEDLSSECVSSFTSASLPLVRQDCPYMYQSTLTLQRILSLFAAEEDQSRAEEEEEEEGEESRTPSSVDVLQNYPELAVTLGGTTDPITLSNLNKDILLELMLSGEEKTAALGEKVHGLPNVSTLWSSVVSLNQDDQSDYIPPQIFSFSRAATSDCFLEEGPHQEACEHHQLTEARGCCTRGFHDVVDQSESRSPCAVFGTTQDLLSDLHQSLQLEEGAACSPRASARMGEPGRSLLIPVHSSTQLPISCDSLKSCTLCNPQTSPTPRNTKHEISLKAQSNTGEACVQSASDHCTMGSWWKQDLETQKASTAAAEPGAIIKSVPFTDKVPSIVLSQPYSYSVVTARQKADSRHGKQADKEELAGWRVPQGAMRSERRRGKRVKRT